MHGPMNVKFTYMFVIFLTMITDFFYPYSISLRDFIMYSECVYCTVETELHWFAFILV